MIRVSAEVVDALAAGRPVVALETTLVAHGFPAGRGVEVGMAAEAAVRERGAVPATVGVLAGEVRVGLSTDELESFGPEGRKVGPRDLAAAAAQGAIGATTVGATLAVCRGTGIRFMATGGIGGVHRGERLDVSADLAELARTEALVVSSGAKSLLDVAATAELLETLGVPVLGYRTETVPLFFMATGGPPVSARVESAEDAARIAGAHWQLSGSSLLVVRPPDVSLDVDDLIADAVEAARERGVSGQDVTPFVLSQLHERSGGRTLEANRDLVLGNARLAAEIAVGYSAACANGEA